jgi:uncharacterized protein YlxW (UPF0749 family)
MAKMRNEVHSVNKEVSIMNAKHIITSDKINELREKNIEKKKKMEQRMELKYKKYRKNLKNVVFTFLLKKLKKCDNELFVRF